MVCRRKKQSSRKRGKGILSSAARVFKGVSGLAGNVTSTILNKVIDNLGEEYHIPGYEYCGPGTKVNKRLKRGDQGINSLDRACKIHDIAYTQNSDNKTRAVADRALANAAWDIFKNPQTPLAEKALSYLVTNVMKAKAAFGGSLRKKKKNERRSYSNNIRRKAIAQLKKHIAGKGYFLKPFPSISGGRVPPLPPSSSYGVSLFPQVEKRRTTKKSRKKTKKKKV